MEIFKPASVTLSGGTVILTEDNSPTVAASGTYLTADVPPLSCSGSGNPGSYTCSGIYSSGGIMWTSFNQQYGDFQIRAKLGYGWPAIRMMGSNCQTTEISGPSSIAPCSSSNADSGELDIVEGSSASAGTTYVLHDLWESGKTNPACTATGLTDITANYHVYEVIVTSTTITWKIDGTQTCIANQAVSDHWFLMIQNAIGGTLGGNPASYSYPNSTTVDWVKVCSTACANGIAGAAASNGTFFDDFLAATYSISGAITNGSGATVTLSGAVTGSVTADASGNYAFNNLSNGTYTVTPTITGQTFTPASQTVTINSASATGVNFAATCSISGAVTNGSGATVRLSGAATGSVTADASGNYAFNNLSNGTYTVTLTKTGQTFTPASQTVTINSTSLTGVNFAATYSISGATGNASGASCGNTLNWTDPACQVISSTTQLSNAWSVVSRHGEYSQGETECNTPSALSIAGGVLTVTTTAAAYTCGNFDASTGAIATTPASWPYTTGDLQWNTLNFTYGTVEMRMKMPARNTGLWVGVWLLGANCQNTNKYTGETPASPGCPGINSSGYEEIDILETKTGQGWGNTWMVHNGATSSLCNFSQAPLDTNWHTYVLTWTTTSVSETIDGASTGCSYSNPPNTPMFLILQTQTTSDSSAGPPNNANLPGLFQIDYVKVTANANTPGHTAGDILFFDDFLGPTTLAVAASSGPFGGTADLSATLTSSGTGVSGKSISFKLNGNDVGSAISDASGNATVASVSLAGIGAGSYPGAVTAAFAGDSVYGASSGSGTLTVQKLAQTITFGALANKTFGDPDFSVSATASSGLAMTFAASGNCTVTGSTVHITGAGSCTITASQAGDGTYSPAPNVQQSFSIAKAAQTITFGALANKTFGDPDFSVSATASSGLTVTFAASGNCTVTGSTVHITGVGSCTITASQAGDSNYNPAADVPRSFSILTLGLPRSAWRVLYVDSEATDCGNYGATNSFDGNNATMWLTEWCNSAPATPHEIKIDLGANYTISGFQYLPRQDPYSGGNIASYEFYVSTDGVNWGTSVSTGTLMTSASDKTQKQVTFTGTAGRYVRLRALTEVNGGPWTSMAELNVLGSAVATSGPQVASVTLSPSSIAGGGTTSTATVTLTSAPLTNATVTLASSNPAAATVPVTVTVNAGATSANFTVTSASSVSATALSVINGTYNGSTGSALLTVTPGSSSALTIPRSGWSVLYVDSQANDCGNYGATNAIDGNPDTMWITEWCHGAPATPHEIQIDLGDSYTISGFQYLPRQDNYSSGNIANYEFYVSADGVNWGTAVAIGKLITNSQDKSLKQVTFTGMVGRYVRLRALSEVNGGPWTNAAEINVLGTVFIPTIPPAGWRLLYADSQATDCGNYSATNAFDGNPTTMWITEWCHGAPATPHEIQIDLGASYTIRGFQYLPRQDNYSSGNIANYEFYVSTDGVTWGTPVASGTLMTNRSDKTQKQVTFAPVIARYVRLRALSEVNGGPWTNAAEINLLGAAVTISGPQVATVMLTPASIAAGGNASTGSVTLSSVPLTDTSVTLTSSNPAAATVPATLTVNAGATTTSFTVTSAPTVSTTVTSVIGAALDGSSGTATLTVVPVALAPITQSGWRVLYVDSQATDCGNYGATNAIDGNPATMWITEWCHDAPATPHEIQIDLGGSYIITGFQYLPRQDPASSGNIANYEFYVSTDGVNWGTAVSTGTLMTNAADKSQKQVTFPATAGHYVRLRALTEVNGGPWTNIAELNVLGTAAWTGILAPSRAINWGNAGVTGGIPNRTTVCAMIDSYDGPADTINNAIANCPSGQVVYLNAGNYNLSTGIVMQSNVTLRGAGADQTFLFFTANDDATCTITPTDVCFQNHPLYYPSSEIQPGGSNSATWTSGFAKGTTQITLSNIGGSGLSVGQYILLDQANDISDNGSLIICDATSPFACSAQGGSPGRTVDGVERNQIQIVKITACTPSCTSGSTFTITPGLYTDNWSAAKNPGAWWMSTIQFAGLENLSLDHSYTGFPTGGAVALAGAMNCWIKGVRSISPGDYRNQVWLFQSAHNTVQDSYFYGALGTSRYGVESHIASDDLIMNNIFQNVDTPLLAGTSEGEVYGYNFSINDNHSDQPIFMIQSNDVHRAGTIYNLFEGNSGNGFRADAMQGTSGLNTLFRNRYNGWESGKTQQLNPIIINSYNRYENLIGNVLGQSGVQTAYQNSDVPIYDIGRGDCCDGAVVADDSIVASTMMRWGNYDTVNRTNRFLASEVPSGIGAYANPVPASDGLPPSFFLNAKPSWWGTRPWPAVGPDVAGGDIPDIDGHAYKLPAQLCYDNSIQGANGILIDFNADRCYAAAYVPPGSSALAVTPAELFFGDVIVGDTQTLAISISNPGTASTIVFDGTASGTEFAIVGPTFPLTLAAGASEEVTISFSPQSADSITSVMTFTSNAASSPVVSLVASGNGMPPIICGAVAPTDLSFGAEILGFTSLQAVTLFNTGNAPLTLFSTTVTDDGYSVTNRGLPITIPVGLSQPITISFTPPGAGQSSSTVTFNTNATCSTTPPVAHLTGTGGFASAHTATLSWTASATATVVGHNVYRSTPPGSLFQKINSVPVTGTSFVDSSLAGGQTYFWVVTAVDGSGLESGFSTQVFATIPTP